MSWLVDFGELEMGKMTSFFGSKFSLRSLASLFRVDFFFLSFSGDLEIRSTPGLATGISLTAVCLLDNEVLSAASFILLRRLLALGDFGGEGTLGGSGDSSMEEASTSEISVSIGSSMCPRSS